MFWRQNGIRCYSVFGGGMIYWTPSAGAHAVSGGILASWSAQGYEASGYGYPVGDMFINDQGAQQQQFEGGVLYADPNVFWQPFSCFNAVTRIAAEYGILGGVQYMCSNRGISFSVNGIDYFGMPTVEDVAKSLPVANLQAAGGAADPTGVECDVYEAGQIWGPYRYSDYRVGKEIEFCIGETKSVSPVAPVEPK
ncbi:LGFP repeat-containing protein [Corynebacterium sp. S7]